MAYCYCRKNDGTYTGNCPTREDAIKEARERYGEDIIIKTARIVTTFTTEYFARSILPDITDMLSIRACAEVGEAAKDWPDISEETEEKMLDEIGNKITPILNKYIQSPEFYLVCNEILHKVI